MPSIPYFFCSKPVSLPIACRNRLNAFFASKLHAVSLGQFLKELLFELEKQDCLMLQEDLTPWQGILCGDKGELHAEIAFLATDQTWKLAKQCVHFTWYRDQGKLFEIVGYVA